MGLSEDALCHVVSAELAAEMQKQIRVLLRMLAVVVLTDAELHALNAAVAPKRPLAPDWATAYRQAMLSDDTPLNLRQLLKAQQVELFGSYPCDAGCVEHRVPDAMLSAYVLQDLLAVAEEHAQNLRVPPLNGAKDLAAVQAATLAKTEARFPGWAESITEYSPEVLQMLFRPGGFATMLMLEAECRRSMLVNNVPDVMRRTQE